MPSYIVCVTVIYMCCFGSVSLSVC